MKNILRCITSLILVGLFYGLVWYGKMTQVVKKTYYDVFGIKYVTMPDKFYSYHVRVDNK